MGQHLGMRTILVALMAACLPHGCAVHPVPDPPRPAHTLGQALLARGPAAGRESDMRLYGRFVGDWDVEMTLYPEDGHPVHARGEWIFGWVLEGRAIQDTWIVPARADRDPQSAKPGPYGTTLRFPAPGSDRWRVTWLNPVNGAIQVMSAREIDGEIVQEGRDEDGRPFRWVFHAITAERFRWRSEELSGEGLWRLNQEMIVTRRR